MGSGCSQRARTQVLRLALMTRCGRLGLAIGVVSARVLAPLLLVFGLAIGALYVFVPRRPKQAAAT